MTYLAKGIRKLKPTSEFSFTEDDYSTIKWDVLDGDAPTLAEIEKAIEQVKKDEIAEEAAKEASKAELLKRLGITADEAKLLLS